MDRGMASRMKKLLIALSFGYDGDHGGIPRERAAAETLFASKWKKHVCRFLRHFAIWKVLDQSDKDVAPGMCLNADGVRVCFTSRDVQLVSLALAQSTAD
jgi:hypothetical protein